MWFRCTANAFAGALIIHTTRKSTVLQSPFKCSVLLIFLIFAVLVLADDMTLALEKAPSFTLADVEGGEFSLSDYSGTTVILDFFATWCGPCVQEIEHLRTLHGEYSADQLVIISIGVDQTESDALLKDFAQDHDMEWRVARDTEQVSDMYGVSLIPHLVIVDSDGYKRYTHVGLTGESTLKNEVESLLSGDGTNGNGDLGGLSIYQISAIVAGVGVLLIVALVIVGRSLGWGKPAKERHS